MLAISLASLVGGGLLLLLAVAFEHWLPAVLGIGAIIAAIVLFTGFITKKRVSLRLRNMEGQKLKVNDKQGNPIEIATVIVWRVQDTAQATFDVDDYAQYVHMQS